MLRKLLSIFTVLFVFLSVIPVGVNAEETPVKITKETPEAALSLTELPLKAVEVNANEERSMEGKPYAVLTEAGDFIFFRSRNDYEDEQKTDATDIFGNKYSGTVFTIDETLEYFNGYRPTWNAPWVEANYDERIKTVRVAEKQKIRPQFISSWFCWLSNMTDIDLHGLDTSECDKMDFMFASCMSLEHLDVSCLDTSSATDMHGMFLHCSSLKTLNLGNMDTGNVTDFTNCFAECESLESLDVSRLDTSSATLMTGMFATCNSLKHIDVSGFDTSSCTDMLGMFSDCISLEEVDVSGFITDKVESFSKMFSGCKTLKYLDLSSFDTSGMVASAGWFVEMNEMFYGMDSLTALRLGKRIVKWKDTTGLPEGIWTNKELNLSLTSSELQDQYPANAEKWAGLWEKKVASPTGVTLDQSSCTLLAGQSETLDAAVLPADADKKVNWTSSDENIAAVDQSGNVKGIKPGYAKITATTSNGLTASCEVRVLFTDIPAAGKYYSDAVYWAVEKGITNGYTDSDGIIRTFKPENNCTREAVVTFLWRLAGKPNPKNLNSPFSDIQDKNKYYYKAVLWAAELGITKGYADGSFKPSATCLREHVVTFLWRYAKQPNPKTSRNPFNDVKTSDYYYKAAIWANENGIAKGYSSGAHAGGFGPKLDCLREHVVTFLYRYAK